MLSISPEEVAARVRAHPWVAEARVNRILPSKIRIDVVERRPALVVETAVGPHLVDAAGVVLQPGTDALAKVVDLPPGTAVFTGERISTPEFAHALSIFNALPPTIRWKVLTIRARSIDGIAVETSQGVSIVYGAAEELEQKNYAAESLLAGATGGTRARVIDVRAPSRPAVRPA